MEYFINPETIIIYYKNIHGEIIDGISEVVVGESYVGSLVLIKITEEEYNKLFSYVADDMFTEYSRHAEQLIKSYR